MIAQLFLPDTIRGYRILSKKTAAITITTEQVIVAVTLYKGYSRILQDFFQVPINQMTGSTGIIDALLAAKQRIGTQTTIELVIPSSNVLFKELTLPFIDAQQIRLVLPAQLESLIPFPIAQGYFDCIITQQSKEASTVLVGIATKEYIDQLLSLCKQATLSVAYIIPDCLAYYCFVQQHLAKPSNCLVVIDRIQTSIMLQEKGHLVAIRTLNKGLGSLASTVAQQHQLETSTVAAQLYKLLAKNTVANQVGTDLTAALHGLVDEIQFSIQALTQQNRIASIDLLTISEAPLLQQFLEQQITPVVHALVSKNIIVKNNLQQRSNNLAEGQYLPVIAALTMPEQYQFNILKDQQLAAQRRITAQGLLVAAALSLMTILVMGGYLIWQGSRLARTVEKAKKEVVSTLQQALNITDAAILRNMDDTIQTSRTLIEQENAVWFAFSRASRVGFLKALQELSELLDKQALQLQISSMLLEPRKITITGSVQGYPALTMFEEEIRKSEMFTLANIPQEPQFTVTLLIKQ
ncbi:type II secretion system protein GspL [Candidatus Dependentiae bacterium]|nr:type II secretion system protein GspL [Candidatus Dependentiae bacterium]